MVSAMPTKTIQKRIELTLKRQLASRMAVKLSLQSNVEITVRVVAVVRIYLRCLPLFVHVESISKRDKI